MNEAPWIKHREGKPCPCPYAKEDEWEFVADNGHTFKGSRPAIKSLLWNQDGEWRLTNDWIPVLGGKMPQEIALAKRHEWEYRMQSGETVLACHVPDTYSWNLQISGRIVAVRLIAKKEERDISTEDGLLHDRPYNKEPVKAAKATKVRDIFAEAGWFHVFNGQCNEKHLFLGEPLECKFEDGRFDKLPYGGGFFADIVAARRVKPDPMQVMHMMNHVKFNAEQLKDKMMEMGILPRDFDPARFLSGRDDAYLRFRNSARGKEALSMIGKAEGPTFKPLGEDTINEIAAAALEAHDKVWPRRKS